MRITVITVKEDYIDAVHEVLPVSGNMIDEKDDRMVLLHAGEHYRAVAPPMVSITHNKDLLQMMFKNDLKSENWPNFSRLVEYLFKPFNRAAGTYLNRMWTLG